MARKSREIVGYGPAILTAKSYTLKSAKSPQTRRDNEYRYNREVTDYLLSIGMSVQLISHETNDHSWIPDKTVVATHLDLKVMFSYRETDHGAYRAFQVTVDGKRSNIQAIRALVENPERWERAWEKRNARRCHAILMGNRGHTRDGMD